MNGRQIRYQQGDPCAIYSSIHLTAIIPSCPRPGYYFIHTVHVIPTNSPSRLHPPDGPGQRVANPAMVATLSSGVGVQPSTGDKGHRA